MRMIRTHNLLNSCSQLMMGIEMLVSVNTELILWALTMFICQFAVPLSLLFLKKQRTIKLLLSFTQLSFK